MHWLNLSMRGRGRTAGRAPGWLLLSWGATCALREAALHFMGITAFKLNRQDEGIELIRRAIALEPTLVSARVDLAVALRDMAQMDEAESVFQEAVAFLPTSSAPALNGRAFSIERQTHTCDLFYYEY